MTPGNGPRRFGQRMQLRPDAVAAYVEAHATVWPDVVRALREAHVNHYSIFLDGCELFAYFEYYGSDFDADMALIDADPVNQEWQALITTYIEHDAAGSPLLWRDLNEVFRLE